jgi:hypothetical protein
MANLTLGSPCLAPPGRAATRAPAGIAVAARRRTGKRRRQTRPARRSDGAVGRIAAGPWMPVERAAKAHDAHHAAAPVRAA